MQLKFVAAVLGLLIVAAHGCSSGDTTVVRQPMDPTKDRLLQVANSYWQYSLTKGVPPRSAADLEPFLRERGSPDDVFRSPRDGEPFVVCWGTNVQKQPGVNSADPVLAYEHTGQDGSRFVIFTERKVELLSDDQFRRANFPAGHGPPK